MSTDWEKSLKTALCKKNLGIHIDEKLEMNQKCALRAQKVNCILGCTQSSMASGLRRWFKWQRVNPSSPIQVVACQIDQSILGKERSTEEWSASHRKYLIFSLTGTRKYESCKNWKKVKYPPGVKALQPNNSFSQWKQPFKIAQPNSSLFFCVHYRQYCQQTAAFWSQKNTGFFFPIFSRTQLRKTHIIYLHCLLKSD